MNRQPWAHEPGTGHNRLIHDNAPAELLGGPTERGHPVTGHSEAERGAPPNPNTDYHHWKRLLTEAGLAVSAATQRAAQAAVLCSECRNAPHRWSAPAIAAHYVSGRWTSVSH
jgi:hypothetical protein